MPVPLKAGYVEDRDFIESGCLHIFVSGVSTSRPTRACALVNLTSALVINDLTVA